MEIIKPGKLTDVEKLSTDPFFFMSTIECECLTKLLLSISRKKKQLWTKDSVEITSNDQPAQIMIFYLSFENHCAGLKCSLDLKYDRTFCLLKDITSVIIIYGLSYTQGI